MRRNNETKTTTQRQQQQQTTYQYHEVHHDLLNIDLVLTMHINLDQEFLLLHPPLFLKRVMYNHRYQEFHSIHDHRPRDHPDVRYYYQSLY